MVSNQSLWQKIDACDFANMQNGLFFQKVINDLGTRSFAQRAIREYKKFIYLATISGGRVVPSPNADKVWHVHLQFTEHYWEDFCPNILGKKIHHMPSSGEGEEKKSDERDAKKTEDLYLAEFGHNPPFGFSYSLWQSWKRAFKAMSLGYKNDKDLFVKTKCGTCSSKASSSGCGGCGD